MKPIFAVALLALGACAANLPPVPAPGWGEWVGAPYGDLAGALDPEDEREIRADGRVFVYRRYRVSESRAEPSLADRDLARQPPSRALRTIELCETRVNVDAAGLVTGVDQFGAGCSELGPTAPQRAR
jgi:hypothetical protein